MSLSDLPLEMINEIVHWLHPLRRLRFSSTCKLYWNFLREDRVLYAEHHEYYCGWAWQAILGDKMEYIDEISAGERWELPEYIPSWEEFSQLDFPRDWLKLGLQLDLGQQKFTPVLAYLITKTPNLEKLEFDYQDDLKYLVNIIPRLECQLTSIRIKAQYVPLSFDIDVDVIHTLLDIPTLKDLFIEGIRGEDYRDGPAPQQSSHTTSVLENLDLAVYDVNPPALQFLTRLPNLQSLHYHDQLSMSGRYILGQLPKCIKNICLDSGWRVKDDNEEVKWDRFECLESIKAMWDDVSWEELPITLRKIKLDGFDPAEYEKITATLPLILSRFPRLESLDINDNVLFPV